MVTPTRRHRVIRLFTSLAGGLSMVAMLGTADAAAVSPPGSGIGYLGALQGVADLSSHDAWAVGYSCASNCRSGAAEVDHTLILHWNGTAWAKVTSPNPHANGRLNAVTALSSSSIWAVGSYCTARCGSGSAVSAALILRWNGTTWTRVASPNPAGSLVTTLNGVSASPRGGMWAAGTYCSVNCYGAQPTPPSRPNTFVLRWDGTAWTQVTSPDPGGRYGSSLYGVSVLSPDVAWAVGNYGSKRSHEDFTPGNSLVLRWNGHTWTQQASPSFGNPAPGSVLHAVSALSAADVLAAGNSYYDSCECQFSLALRWNGTAWAKVKSPDPGNIGDGIFAPLNGISTLSPTDAWAAGWWLRPNVGYLTLVAHWNGRTWTKVPSPNVPAGTKGGGSYLNAVSASRPSDLWAVGYYATADETYRTLILHWNGTAWKLT